jgi:outer membrane autotransporter protein
MTRIAGALIVAGLRRALLVGAALVGIALAAPAPAQAQNLVVNGGFETGNFTGWTNETGWGVGAFGSVVHTGTFAAGTGCTSFPCAVMDQSLNLTVGATYTVSLWVANTDSGAGVAYQPNQIKVRIGAGPVPPSLSGTPVISQSFTAAAPTFASATFTATSAIEYLQIEGINIPAGIYIDDICVSLSSFCGNALVPQLPAGSPINPTNVAAAIDAFTNGGGTLPAGFQNLFSLTPDQLSAALSQLSGEAATGAQTGAFQLMNSFLNLMIDQSLDAGNGNGVGLASGFAPERQALPADVALAYASMLKAPPARSSQPWSVWGSAYGGTNHANGDSIVVGSHDVRTNTWGVAAGLDYRLSPDTKIGFALGGAGTNWGLSDGLGGGKSDAFQAGIYGLTRSGPAYLSGALAYSSYWVSTDRVAVAGDQLTANFNAYGIGGRLEGGYRFATPVVGFTPYAALQAQSFHIPSYSETDVTGGGFGLAYNAHTASDTRSELGARLDKQIALDNGAVLALRGRAAWAHDWVTDPSLTAAFLALPGGGAFIVNGATPAHDSALVTAGAEIKLRSGWSVMAKFDGEFASGSQTYIGTGKLRYSW